jgi:hypothetical protein
MKKLLFISILILSACTKHVASDSHQFETIAPEGVKFDLVFPQPLWDLIINSAPKEMNVQKSAYELFNPLLVHVQVIQNHAEVFDGKSYQFEFKDFGGEIDWNNYLNRSENGSFSVRFEFPKVEHAEMKVFFMGWTKQFTRDGENFGSGCNTILDLTSYFQKTVLKKGLLLHTNELRYFYATAGRFYFVFYEKDKIDLAQVTFTDSSLKNKMCENLL